jgi:hypothetical protein
MRIVRFMIKNASPFGKLPEGRARVSGFTQLLNPHPSLFLRERE